ncbi:MAG: dihydroorotate dehydrogenase [Candidatus Azotimanducaceae bacterium]|jgi:dihydroorotate dehydrogenase
MNYDLLQKLMFLLPTETSHHLSLQSIALMEQLNLSSLVANDQVQDPVELMGIRFPNRVGLAAGLDKDAKCIEGMSALGFGFLEVGTVTPKPQAGNPKPRLFRLKSKNALINRMGFNNEGVDAMIKRIRRSKFEGVLGINIGKNATTGIENALSDYEYCMRKVYKFASYIVVNISSPNTEGLRSLQHGDELSKLLDGLKREHASLVAKHQKYIPLLVKIAPDMDDEEVTALTTKLVEFELDGIIVSNTTVSRGAVEGQTYANEMGGLSGEPLKSQSDHVLSIVSSTLAASGNDKKMVVIGVGGIHSAQDALNKIKLGADLVQIYTGFIYRGPDLIHQSASIIQASLPQAK